MLEERLHSLRQVPAGAGQLGPVGLGHAEGVAQGGYAGLQVELGRLRQVSLLAKVVKAEERGAALHLGLHHGRGGDLCPNAGWKTIKWWFRKKKQLKKKKVEKLLQSFFFCFIFKAS